MSTETDRITRLLEKTYHKHPWYGLSILETISNINAEIVERRYGATHSIIELVRHMTSWRIFATKRLQGDNDFEVTDELNFPKAGTWKEAVENLDDSQKNLVAAVKTFPDTKLGDLVPSKSQKYTYYTLLHGIIQHDIYHLGQIAYIKKSLS